MEALANACLHRVSIFPWYGMLAKIKTNVQVAWVFLA